MNRANTEPEVIHGDALEVLRDMDDDSVDAVVTDPPYGLSFMGKRWDYDVPSEGVWRECLRVLKPGGHCLAFAGSRTYHRMAVAIEDAGFTIRDQIMWLYGSGFPKSHDVSKAIDKAAGIERAVVGVRGRSGSSRSCMSGDFVGGEYMETEPATPAARQWNGWGTALKPAHEPIVMARKPLVGTVADNVCKHGTGAINVDGCRVAAPGEVISNHGESGNSVPTSLSLGARKPMQTPGQLLGRWPANVMHDGSDEATVNMGEAARYFYSPKASKSDRGADNVHPTVKPTALMAYLCRLVTPPKGLILDPFAGSGTTGIAALREGFRAVLIEREPEYVDIIHERIRLECGRPSQSPPTPDACGQPSLFG